MAATSSFSHNSRGAELLNRLAGRHCYYTGGGSSALPRILRPMSARTWLRHVLHRVMTVLARVGGRCSQAVQVLATQKGPGRRSGPDPRDVGGLLSVFVSLVGVVLAFVLVFVLNVVIVGFVGLVAVVGLLVENVSVTGIDLHIDLGTGRVGDLHGVHD